MKSGQKEIISPPYLKMTMFTLAISAIVYTIKYFKPSVIYPQIEFVLAFFLALFLLSYFLMSLSIKESTPKKAVILNMAAVIFRLIACSIAAFVFVKNDPENHKVFVVNFMLIYLFYLGFEIYSILSNLRPNLKS